MSDQIIDQIENSELFLDIDETGFPAHLPLRSILKNDSRIRQYKKDQVIVRAGEYVNSAHIILSGSAFQILPPGLEPIYLGQKKQSGQSVLRSIYHWIKRPRVSEQRELTKAKSGATNKHHLDAELDRYFIPYINRLIESSGLDYQLLKAGDVIGESAVLGRNEVTNTVVSCETTIALEIRWQGLRDIRKWAPGFKKTIDDLYRSQGLYEHLLTVPLFKHLSNEKIRELASIALFEVHGEFEWHKSYSASPDFVGSTHDYDEILQKEPLIVEEGHYPDGLLLVRNGFARISRRVNHGLYTLGYLCSGDMFGLEEIFQSWQSRESKPLNCSLRALGYTDLIRIPTAWLEHNIFKHPMAKDLVETLAAKDRNFDQEKSAPAQTVDRDFTEFLVEHRFINGSATMIINLERCIRCDECVTGCANNHNNNPRFIRQGKSLGKFMIANACMHCEDPVCMIGCPTGAIHRSSSGIVKINDDTCIGCSTCANSCPYNNIQMVEIKDKQDNLVLDQNEKPILKATKCDLCSDSLGKPACVRSCPHDALVRLDVKDTDALSDWINS